MHQTRGDRTRREEFRNISSSGTRRRRFSGSGCKTAWIGNVFILFAQERDGDGHQQPAHHEHLHQNHLRQGIVVSPDCQQSARRLRPTAPMLQCRFGARSRTSSSQRRWNRWQSCTAYWVNSGEKLAVVPSRNRAQEMVPQAFGDQGDCRDEYGSDRPHEEQAGVKHRAGQPGDASGWLSPGTCCSLPTSRA